VPDSGRTARDTYKNALTALSPFLEAELLPCSIKTKNGANPLTNSGFCALLIGKQKQSVDAFLEGIMG
jgi:hypothetical protein